MVPFVDREARGVGNEYEGAKQPDNVPYRPKDYEGPTFSNTTPYDGYGKPTSYLFDIYAGNAATPLWKNFGVHGYSTVGGKSYREGDLDTCVETYMTITLVPTENPAYDQKAKGHAIEIYVKLYDWDKSYNTAVPASQPYARTVDFNPKNKL